MFNAPNLRDNARERFPAHAPAAMLASNIMDKTDIGETHTEEETERLREAALKQLLATPPKPNKASGKGKRESSQSK